MKGTFFAVLICAVALSVTIDARINKFIPKAPVLLEQFSAPRTNNVNFGTSLLSYFNAFQSAMPCGVAAEGIPPLSPFTVQYLPFNFTSEYYRITGSMSNLMVNGLDDFRILKLTYNSTTNRTSFDLNFSQIQTLSEYNMGFWAMMAGIPVTFFGDGVLNWKFIDYRLVGDFVIAPSANDPNSLEVSDFNMQFFFGDIIANNWNNLWSIAINNFVNEIVPLEALMFAQVIQPYVDGILSANVVPMLNNMLQGVNMSDLIAYLEVQTMTFNSIAC